MSCCGGAKGGVIRQEDLDRGLAFEIEYAGARTITVIGAVTRHAYTFSGLQRLQLVDPRDAGPLLRERAFRLTRMIPPTSS